ncbi:MAG: hypothetical protein R6W79_05710 [Acidimicrobiia bacterium]
MTTPRRLAVVLTPFIAQLDAHDDQFVAYLTDTGTVILPDVR